MSRPEVTGPEATRPETSGDTWARLTVLSDPVRRRLYDYVAAHEGPTRREEAATAAGISRTLAAYHLDRLTEAGLLTTSYARTSGRTGPGAGRPAKHYERADEEVAVTVPPRSYDILARLLAEAIAADDSDGTGSALGAALTAAAEAEGRSAAATDQDLITVLMTRGYEPDIDDGGNITLRNCPFHRLARQHTDLVCNLNHALLRGCLIGCDEDPGRADLAPRPGHCCVVIRPPAA
ncbi:metalloregulator ArsR/SmtB family transcription factor [Microlunatus sp. Gsoil 973]|uniref:helix-turn-helix transcriptional regulator n=1 Tax=Microlunatus sp. Gsoil 973 TaxID=2672569 RepID=UPI0012B4B7B9|nr:helix-turn-helix domain-containing protein [Microlunatus sp. Gsoil 973]QGN34896.1 helix-turn-helix domain-containing protein [Microlunatus sp. Gsoil 973]